MFEVKPNVCNTAIKFIISEDDAESGETAVGDSDGRSLNPQLLEFVQRKKQRKIPQHMRPKYECEARFVCPKCGKGYSLAKNMRRHARLECDQEPKYACPHCPLRCKRNNQLQRHINSRHSNKC